MAVGVRKENPVSKGSVARIRFITSGRFESRRSRVKVLPSRSLPLRGLERLVFGIPVAHGEGRLIFQDARECCVQGG